MKKEIRISRIMQYVVIIYIALIDFVCAGENELTLGSYCSIAEAIYMDGMYQVHPDIVLSKLGTIVSKNTLYLEESVHYDKKLKIRSNLVDVQVSDGQLLRYHVLLGDNNKYIIREIRVSDSNSARLGINLNNLSDKITNVTNIQDGIFDNLLHCEASTLGVVNNNNNLYLIIYLPML